MGLKAIDCVVERSVSCNMQKGQVGEPVKIGKGSRVGKV